MTFGIFLLALFGGGLLIATAGLITAIAMLRKAHIVKPAPALAKLPSEEFKRALQAFSSIVDTYRLMKLPAAKELHSLMLIMTDLFDRLKLKGGVQLEVASLEYTGVLERLNVALGERYYLDIVRNPQLWDNAEERKYEVEQAVEAVELQMTENIKRVNASMDLDYRLGVETLNAAASHAQAVRTMLPGT